MNDVAPTIVAMSVNKVGKTADLVLVEGDASERLSVPHTRPEL
jgi:hypothetical protein